MLRRLLARSTRRESPLRGDICYLALRKPVGMGAGLVISAFGALTIAMSVARAADDNQTWHPARELSMEVVRNCILATVEATPELQGFVNLDSLRDELPFECDLYFPERWPGLSINLPPRRFAKLGEWELTFGPDEGDPEGKDSEYFLRRIIFKKKKYLTGDADANVEYVQVVMEPKATAPTEAWEDGTIQKIEIEGWRVERFRLKSRGAYLKGIGVEYIAAGGTQKSRAGEYVRASITDVAFIGRVEHCFERRMP